MKKPTKTLVCQQCGSQTAKWQGKCPSCGAWNSFVEEYLDGSQDKEALEDYAEGGNEAQRIEDISTEALVRHPTHLEGFDSLLGGGLVPGSVVLLGGEPGAGKSTLLLEVLLGMEKTVLYVSGEESISQLKLQIHRLGLEERKGGITWLLSETGLERILQSAKKHRPSLLAIDSIQTLHSLHLDAGAGSISQVRNCTMRLIRYAKATHTTVFLIGHITKEGHLAGPKVIEHMVDTVFQLEGERKSMYRILRAHKNRFGAVFGLCMYRMEKTGMKEVRHPSSALLSHSLENASGNAIACVLEGNRAWLLEVQALVSEKTYSTVQRLAHGVDTGRLYMLLALMEKKIGMPFNRYDVFVNLAGGFRMEDTAMDLAICMALVSSLSNTPLPNDTAYACEVGLSGELRPVMGIKERCDELQSMHYKRLVISGFGSEAITHEKVHIVRIKTLAEAFSFLEKGKKKIPKDKASQAPAAWDTPTQYSSQK